MPAANPKRWLSLDTGIAVRLGERVETSHLFCELAQERGFKLFLVPTALAELECHSRQASGALQRAASHVLECRKAWGIHCALPAKPDFNRHTEWLVAKLRSKGYIPVLERRDSLILAEAAVARIPILVAADIPYDTDNAALAYSLAELGEFPVAIFKPSNCVLSGCDEVVDSMPRADSAWGFSKAERSFSVF
jgi:hypothetical protein